MTDPMDLFREWHRHASNSSSMAHPNAMCVSTVDAAGIPYGRFVDLKAVRRDGFVFCTSYASPKSQHIESQPHLSLTFWWDHVRRQVRVLGSATRISTDDADAFFAERSRAAQLASWAYDQSHAFGKNETLSTRAELARQRFGDAMIPRPPDWGGYLITPYRIEFLTFSEDRAHERVLYVFRDSRWMVSELQP